MAKLYITEYQGTAPGMNGVMMPVPLEPALSTGEIKIQGEMIVTEIQPSARLLRIIAEEDCLVSFSANRITVGETWQRFNAEMPEYRGLAHTGKPVFVAVKQAEQYG